VDRDPKNSVLSRIEKNQIAKDLKSMIFILENPVKKEGRHAYWKNSLRKDTLKLGKNQELTLIRDMIKNNRQCHY
jgi:hypothetical protein